MKATVFHHSVHLPEQDLLAPDPSCPFCASTERTPIAVLQEEPEVVLLHCRGCHASSASRMPKLEALTRYYENYYGEKEEKITINTPTRIASHIYKHSKSVSGFSISPEISILDYGGGDGTISMGIANSFLELGTKKVYIALVDYDQSLKEAAGTQISIVRPHDLSEISNQTMDLVIASAVIEHLPEPQPVLDKLFASMKIGGCFYARTPYVFPLMKLASALNTKFDFTYPAHVHDLGARYWNNITNQIPAGGRYQIIRSTPSLVETSFQQHFFRTLAAYILKVPGYLFKESYGLVGGWEVFIRRLS